MHDFILKEIINPDIEKELNDIGFDKVYINQFSDKFLHKNIKIFDLTIAEANILKQTALSFGADCATHRETITGKIETTDCILTGSVAQLRKISEKLYHQPFNLKKLGEQIKSFHITKDNTTKLVGILNLTTDSFSDGGQYFDTNDAIKHIQQLILDGADIIDIGAESTRSGALPIDAGKQIEKILPVLDYAIKNNIKVSIDTRSSIVAEECIKCGAKFINDVSGFNYDKNMANVIAKYDTYVIIQHSKGFPIDMQDNPQYSNLMDEIFLTLKSKVDFAKSKGINNIIIDPGIGFGKTIEHNFEIIKRIEELNSLNCPIMMGLSRKSLLNIQNADNLTKDIYTLALNTLLINKKVDYLRVHNVKLHKQLLDIIR